MKKLKPGMAAPDFQCVDQHGKFISLKNLQGKKVLISFFRFSACALCNLHVHQLIQRYPNWKKQGLEIIAFFESPVENVQKHVGTQQAPFSLVADPKADIYNLYQVETSIEKIKSLLNDEQKVQTLITQAATSGFSLTHEEGSNFHRLPAEFLIHENGIIHTAHYNQSIEDHLPLEQIDRFVKKISN